MKIQITGLAIALFICSAFAKPGGMYTLTGEEKGIDAIVKADMQQFPEYYKGETFRRYLAEFKKVNNIGKKQFKPGDQLRFPDTKASKSTDDALPEPKETIFVDNAAQLKKAIGVASPGDHIVLKKNATWSALKQIRVNRNGTEENPIVIRAEEVGKVKITEKSQFYLAGQYIILHGLLFTEGREKITGAVNFTATSSHCRMTRCTITNLNTIEDRATKWVWMEGTYNRIDHCFFSEQRCKGQTIAMEGNYPNYHRIDHNHFIGMPKSHIQNGRETIKLGGGSGSADQISRTVVEYNLFEKCNADGEIISVKSDENIIRYNTFKNHKSGHLSNRAGDRTRIEGNIFLDNGLGIRIYGKDHVIINNYFMGGGTGIYLGIGSFENIGGRDYKAYDEPVNTIIAHNTFCGLHKVFMIGIGNGLPPENTRILNNVVKGTYIERAKSKTQAFWIAEKVKDITCSGNIIYDTEDQPEFSGYTIQDPLLTENKYGILQLTSRSPCINGGGAVPLPIVMDIKKDARSDQRRDIGCEEYNPGHTFRALTAEDVGPFSH